MWRKCHSYVYVCMHVCITVCSFAAVRSFTVYNHKCCFCLVCVLLRSVFTLICSIYWLWASSAIFYLTDSSTILWRINCTMACTSHWWVLLVPNIVSTMILELYVGWSYQLFFSSTTKWAGNLKVPWREGEIAWVNIAWYFSYSSTTCVIVCNDAKWSVNCRL